MDLLPGWLPHVTSQLVLALGEPLHWSSWFLSGKVLEQGQGKCGLSKVMGITYPKSKNVRVLVEGTTLQKDEDRGKVQEVHLLAQKANCEGRREIGW